MDIDAVEQRSGDAGAVTLDLLLGTAAAVLAQVTAGTGIRGYVAIRGVSST